MFSRNVNIFSIARRINRPLILDGAMGSLLQKKYQTKGSLWMSYLNLENPDEVIKVHKNYIRAGADILTTNTFRTNPQSLLKNKSYNGRELVKHSVSIAREAVNNCAVLIAGSNPPAEDCYQKVRTIRSKMLEMNHHKHINLLWFNGVHFILNETQSHLDEILIICKYCSSNNIPFVISIYFEEDLKILSGEKLQDVLEIILHYAPLAVGFNCIQPENFIKFYRTQDFYFNWGVYFNCGSGNPKDQNISCGITPKQYSKLIKQILEKSPSFVGACCGSSPSHIKELKKIFDDRNCS